MAFTDWDSWNINGGSDRLVLFQIRYYNTTTNTEEVHYVSSSRFGSYESSGDVISTNIYYSTLVSAPTLSRGSNQIGAGVLKPAIGTIRLSNIDQFYDDFINHVFIGRLVGIFVGPKTGEEFKNVFRGEVTATTYSGNYFEIEVRDTYARFDKPVQREFFGSGANIPPEIELIRRPMAFGYVKQVSPVIQHDTSYIFQTNNDDTQNVSIDPRVDGVTTSLITSETASLGIMSLSASPVGTFTTNTQGTIIDGTYSESIGTIVEYILTKSMSGDYPVIASAWIDDASITAINSDSTLDIAWASMQPNITVNEVLRQLMPMGYLYGFDMDGYFFIKHLKDPSGETATQTLSSSDILKNSVTITEPSAPFWKMLFQYDKNYTPLTNIGNVSAAARAILASEYRSTYEKVDTTILDKYEDAKEITVTLYASGGVEGANEEADRLWDLFSVTRRVYEIRCWAKPLAFEIGEIVEVTYPYHGLSGGVNLVYIGSEHQLDQHLVTAYFWG